MASRRGELGKGVVRALTFIEVARQRQVAPAPDEGIAAPGRLGSQPVRAMVAASAAASGAARARERGVGIVLRHRTVGRKGEW